MCFLSDNIYDYYNVSQGKVTVPNMDDGEEFQLADVSSWQLYCLYSTRFYQEIKTPYNTKKKKTNLLEITLENVKFQTFKTFYSL